jgi:hypothetical protein
VIILVGTGLGSGKLKPPRLPRAPAAGNPPPSSSDRH